MYRKRSLAVSSWLSLVCVFSIWISTEALGALGVVKLAWDRNPEPSVAGYKVKYGLSTGRCTTTLDVGNVITHNVPDLTVGTTYYFVVVAYSFFGLESDPSNEVFGSPASGRPTANAASLTVSEDTPQTVTLAGTDSASLPLTYIIVTPPTRALIHG